MASDTTKTIIQQSDLNNNGVLDHPSEVAHLEHEIKQRIAAMNPAEKMEAAQAALLLPPKLVADGLSEKPIATLDGVGISQKALQKVLNAIQDGVEPEIYLSMTGKARSKQHDISEPVVPERTPKGQSSNSVLR